MTRNQNAVLNITCIKFTKWRIIQELSWRIYKNWRVQHLLWDSNLWHSNRIALTLPSLSGIFTFPKKFSYQMPFLYFSCVLLLPAKEKQGRNKIKYTLVQSRCYFVISILVISDTGTSSIFSFSDPIIPHVPLLHIASDPVRSASYFPEWKLALIKNRPCLQYHASCFFSAALFRIINTMNTVLGTELEQYICNPCVQVQNN